MDPLNLLVARQNAADQVRETAESGKPKDRCEPAKDGKHGPVVQVGWWHRLAVRWRHAREIGSAATRRRVTVLR
ncbi:hypothetical protein GCM10009741_24520 [Kribbella lupini]|uniref:Uncharacterized protein n=1 Tax=Kribbella lupini TaxID=291602 RepID=A0ABN2AMH7_9ACTN